MLIALTSAKGSPGVTTSALALALSWRTRVVVAELDPAGGEVLAGYGGARLPASGLDELLCAARRGGLDQQLLSHLVRLDTAGRVLLLPGLTDPAAARTVDWDRLAGALTGLAASGADVLVDCGRLRADRFPVAVLRRAAAVVLVTGSTLRAVRAAQLAVPELRALLTERASGELGALVIGLGEPYSEGEIAAALGVPVIGALPRDRRAAAVLSDGAPAGRLFSQSNLLRAARGTASVLADFAAARHRRLVPPPEVIAAAPEPVRAASGSGHGD